jgi:hypothetical protein
MQRNDIDIILVTGKAKAFIGKLKVWVKKWDGKV